MTEFKMGGIKLKEIAEIWYGDLEALFAEHLGVEIEHWDSAQGKSVGYSITRELADGHMGFGNGYIHIYDPRTPHPYPEDTLQFEQYINQLVEKGVLPNDREIYVTVWW